MIDTSSLADYVGANTTNNVQDSNPYAPPPKPKKGEIIVCQMCGRPMYPKDFSKIEKIRKYEFKWHIHWGCQQEVFNQLDIEEGAGNLTNANDEQRMEAARQARIQIQNSPMD